MSQVLRGAHRPLLSINMSNINLDKPARVSKAWIALRRLDKNVKLVSLYGHGGEEQLPLTVEYDRVVALQEVSIPPAAEVATIIQIISTAFGLNSSDVIFKMRNHGGRLIPLNNAIPANIKRMPYVLEVSKVFQHVHPKPRTIPITVVSKSTKTKLQTIDKRIQRLEEILPEIKLRRTERLSQEIDCLNQKLRFLHKRMQVADSRSWNGALTRAPLW